MIKGKKWKNGKTLINICADSSEDYALHPLFFSSQIFIPHSQVVGTTDICLPFALSQQHQVCAAEDWAWYSVGCEYTHSSVSFFKNTKETCHAQVISNVRFLRTLM